MRAHWGRAFEVLAYDEGGVCGQDAVLLRRRPVAPSAPELEAPEPNEPRSAFLWRTPAS